MLISAFATSPPALAQQAAPEAAQQAPAQGGAEAPHGTQGADAPGGLPPPNYPASPYRGVIDGSGKPIPCRCRFDGKSYQLGEIVCMNTYVGTVLTRCDIFGNNTSWIPSRQPCTPKVGS
ncbi:MAG: hypothetical protein ABI391_03835 [Hyphomicrobiaceae bacterium]